MPAFDAIGINAVATDGGTNAVSPGITPALTLSSATFLKAGLAYAPALGANLIVAPVVVWGKASAPAPGAVLSSSTSIIVGTAFSSGQTIDALLVPSNRWVSFEASSRSVVFEGTSRIVSFEGY